MVLLSKQTKLLKKILVYSFRALGSVGTNTALSVDSVFQTKSIKYCKTGSIAMNTALSVDTVATNIALSLDNVATNKANLQT